MQLQASALRDVVRVEVRVHSVHSVQLGVIFVCYFVGLLLER